MSPSISKPDPASFRKYLLGESSEAEAASVEAYLESNPDLTPMPVPPGDDTLLACLRGQADVTPVESPQIRRALDWLKNVGIDSEPEALTNLSDFAAGNDTDDAADEVLRLLGKSDASGGFGELGGYKILRVLGRGGMGVVLEAEDPKLGRRVALKAMRPNIANNATAKQRFLREAKSAAKVENDHIVPIYQVGEDRGILFLAMPYLKGEPLDAKLKREPKLPAAEVARIGRQVAEGLAAAHEAGLVHRDIKPANIWLEQTRNAELGTRSEDRNSPLRVPSSAFRAKILDFGLARLEGPQDVQITGSGTLLGTPAYMAPEQASGKQVDARADLFSLGVVLYRAATGSLPFKGDSPMAILTSLALDTPSHASLANLELPTAIGDLIARLLEKDPTKRPQSAQEVAKAFADIQSDLAGETIPVGLLVKPIVAPLDPWNDIDDVNSSNEPAAQARVAAKSLARAAGSQAKPPRKKLLIAGGLLALAAAIAAVVIVIIKDKDGKEVARINVPDGGSVEIKDDGKGKKDGPKPVADADRKAAEWFVKNHSSINVKCAGQPIDDIHAADQLPNRPFTIRSIRLSPKTPLDGALENLRQLTGVEQLILDGLGITDGWLDRLASYPGMTKSLTSINLNPTLISDAGMAHLKRFSNLQSLTVRSPTLTDKGLAALGGMKLRALFIAGSGITDGGMEHLQGLVEMYALSLWQTSVGDAGLLHLKTLPIGQLQLVGGKFTDRGLKTLAEFPKLYALSLEELPITDQSLAALKDCKSLSKLYVNNSKVTDAGLAHLTGLDLVELQLNKCAIGDTGLETLAKLKKLLLVHLLETKATAAGVKKLAAAMPQCTIYSDYGTFAPISPDRKAAEWFVKNQASIDVDCDGQTISDIRAADKLPNRPFTIRSIQLSPKTPLDGALENLRQLTGVESMNLEALGITDGWLAQLASYPGITGKLNGINLSGSQLTDAGMAHLKRFSNLRHLSVSSPALTDKGLGALGGMKLADLRITGLAITDAGVEHLRGLAELQWLNLYQTSVTDAGLVHLKALPALSQLILDGGKFTDLGFKTLAEFPRLVFLAASDLPITDQGLAALKNCKNLATLSVHPSKVTDAGLAHLTGLNLTNLDLSESAVGDAGLETLAKLKKLITIHLKGIKATEAGVKKLAAALPQCTIYSDYGTFAPISPDRQAAEWFVKNQVSIDVECDGQLVNDIRAADKLPNRPFTIRSIQLSPKTPLDGALENLRQLTGVEVMYLGESSITDGWLDRLASITGIARNLKTINLNSSQLTDAGMAHLKRFPNLQALTVNSPTLTDKGLAALGGMKLRSLNIAGAGITDGGMEHLQGLVDLVLLRLDSTAVTDAGLRRLKTLPMLGQLALAGGKFTDRGLKNLAEFPKLGSLTLGGLPITDQSLAALRDCKGLSKLYVNNSKVTDAGLAHLTGLDLDEVQLNKCAVGDAGLETLAKLKKLHIIHLLETKATEAGVKKLAALLPKCTIYSDHGNFGPLSLDPDRKAAEWVLSIGGVAGLGEPVAGFLKIADLPRVPFQLTHVTLASLPQVSDAGLAAFQNCKNLTSLLLYQTQVGDAGLEHLKGLAKLMKLDLRDTKVTAEGVADLQKALPKCQILSDFSIDAADRKAAEWVLSIGGKVTIETEGNLREVAAAKDLPVGAWKLVAIGLANNNKVTDDGLANLQKLTNLLTLELGGTKVSDAGMVHLKSLTKLTGLNLDNTAVSDAGLEHFKTLTNLSALALRYTKVSDAGLEHLKTLTNIWHLMLIGTKVSDAGLAHLKTLTKLRELNLDSTAVSDAGLEHLKTLTKLSSLHLGDTKVTAVGVAALQKALPKCNIVSDFSIDAADRKAAEWVLSIGGLVQINGEGRYLKGIADLPREPFRLTTVYMDANRQVTDDGLAVFKDCKNLTSLSLADTKVTDAGMVHFRDCKDLKGLNLHNAQISDTGLANFKDCKNLIGLHLGRTKVTDAGLAHFKNCNLAQLALGGTQVTDLGVAYLKGCKNLVVLDLHFTKVSDTGLANFKDCKDLENIGLLGTPITDKGLTPFHDCKKLTVLDLVQTKVTKAGIDALKKALPGCKIAWDEKTDK